MKLDEFVTKLRAKQLEDKTKQDEVKKKYKAKDKVKKLTLTERIERIEEILGIE